MSAGVCRHGHPWTAANTYTHPTTGQRQCRQCMRDQALRSRTDHGLTARQWFVVAALAGGGRAWMPPRAPVAMVELGDGTRDRTSRLALRHMVRLGLLSETRSGSARDVTFEYQLTPQGTRLAREVLRR